MDAFAAEESVRGLVDAAAAEGPMKRFVDAFMGA